MMSSIIGRLFHFKPQEGEKVYRQKKVNQSKITLLEKKDLKRKNKKTSAAALQKEFKEL